MADTPPTTARTGTAKRCRKGFFQALRKKQADTNACMHGARYPISTQPRRPLVGIRATARMMFRRTPASAGARSQNS